MIKWGFILFYCQSFRSTYIKYNQGKKRVEIFPPLRTSGSSSHLGIVCFFSDHCCGHTIGKAELKKGPVTMDGHDLH